MDNNLLADFTKWEKGKDYPDFFDDVALSTISKTEAKNSSKKEPNAP